MTKSWRFRHSVVILSALVFLMCIVIASIDIIDGKTNFAIFYIFISIYLFILYWLRYRKPLVVVSNENIVINQKPFDSKVIKWQDIQEIKRVTKHRISLLIYEDDSAGIQLSNIVNIWLGNINRDERESLIQTIKDHFESSRKPQEIIPAN